MFKYLKLNNSKLNDDRRQSGLDAPDQSGLSKMEKAAIQLVLQPQGAQVVNQTAKREMTTALPSATNFAIGKTVTDRGTHADKTVAPKAENNEEFQADPLTYFHSYGVEESNGADANERMYSNSPNPEHQQSFLGSLIGAIVVVATLASGFVIADTLKNQPSIAEKQPLQPSSQLSWVTTNSTTGMWRPPVVSPVIRRSEAPLPNPKASMGLNQTALSQSVPLILPQPKAGIALNQNFPPLPAPSILPQPAMPVAQQKMTDVASRPSTGVVSPQPVVIVPPSTQSDAALNATTPVFTPIATANGGSPAIERPVVKQSRSGSDAVELGTPVGGELSTPMPPNTPAVTVPIPVLAANPETATPKQVELAETSAIAESSKAPTAEISPVNDDTDKNSFTW